LARLTHRPSWIPHQERWVAPLLVAPGENATGATVDSTGLTAVIVVTPRRMEPAGHESNPIFERYRIGCP
jgi:hypothetical protein